MSKLKKASNKIIDRLLETNLVSLSNVKDAQQLAASGFVQGLRITKTGSSISTGAWVFSKRAMSQWYWGEIAIDGDDIVSFSCACATAYVYHMMLKKSTILRLNLVNRKDRYCCHVLSTIYAAILNSSSVAPPWALPFYKKRPAGKPQPSYVEREMPSFNLSDVQAGYALDPRKKLGKALSGTTFTELHARKSMKFVETKYVAAI